LSRCLLRRPSVKYKRRVVGYFFMINKYCLSSCPSEMSLAVSSVTSCAKVICDVLLLNLRDCCRLYFYLMGNYSGVGYWRLGDETSTATFFHTIFFKNKIKIVLSEVNVGNVLYTTNPKRSSSEKKK
jgi:hypothetical protein